MKVDYDSEAHSLLFEFGERRQFEDGDSTVLLGDDACIIFVHEGSPGTIQLLGADEDIGPLDEAAERFDLDAEGLKAAALAALAAPNREIKIEVGGRLGDDDEVAA